MAYPAHAAAREPARPQDEAPAERRPSAKARRRLLTVHVVLSVALVGSTASIVVLAIGAARTDDPARAHAAYASVLTGIFTLGIPFSLAALATGLALVVSGGWSLLRHRWITAKLALLAAIVLNGMLGVKPWAQQLANATAIASNATEPSLGAARWELPTAAALNIAFAVAATTLGIHKPARRRRPTRHAQSNPIHSQGRQ
jgi:uncharacterized membrane protein